jgi:hypothetical protein
MNNLPSEMADVRWGSILPRRLLGDLPVDWKRLFDEGKT